MKKMAKPTKILSDEHKNILKVADALEKECNIIKSGKSLDKNFFEKAIYFIRNYADRFHHAKEEDILFKEMCKPSTQGEIHCNPIEQMLYEHNIGRDFVKNTENSLKKNDKTKVVENALGYVQLIREHIYKEDNILYPMADEALDKKTQDAISVKFEKEEKLREKTKKECLDIVKMFEKRN